jgi:hypothetical protein
VFLGHCYYWAETLQVQESVGLVHLHHLQYTPIRVYMQPPLTENVDRVVVWPFWGKNRRASTDQPPLCSRNCCRRWRLLLACVAPWQCSVIPSCMVWSPWREEGGPGEMNQPPWHCPTSAEFPGWALLEILHSHLCVVEEHLLGLALPILVPKMANLHYNNQPKCRASWSGPGLQWKQRGGLPSACSLLHGQLKLWTFYL